jgi:hypothetical protein
MRLDDRSRYESLSEASQPDVLDHPANPYANPPAITLTLPPPTNGVVVDYYLLAHRPSTSVHQINSLSRTVRGKKSWSTVQEAI